MLKDRRSTTCRSSRRLNVDVSKTPWRRPPSGREAARCAGTAVASATGMAGLPAGSAPYTMTHILHRHLHVTPPVAVGGRGVFLIDASGRQYLDASGGAAVSCLGHGHPDVTRGDARADRSPGLRAHQLLHVRAGGGARRSADQPRRPTGLEHVYLVSGGSEAVETALKMARQYFVEIGEPERSLFVARRQSYHGNTLGALAVGGNARRRAMFAPLLDRRRVTSRRATPIASSEATRRPRRTGCGSRRSWTTRSARAATQRVIAFVAETVGGATSGALTPVPGYFSRGPRGLRSPRRTADPRRGDVRDGTYGHAARLRAGRRRAGPAGDRQGARRRLSADRRRARARADRRGDVSRQRLLPARPHLSRSSRRVRGGARGAADDRARPVCCRTCARGADRSRPGWPSGSPIIRTSATSEAADSSTRSSWFGIARAKRRSIPRGNCTRASSARAWRAG